MIRLHNPALDDRLQEMTQRLAFTEERAEELDVNLKCLVSFPDHAENVLNIRRERLHREIAELKLKIAMLPDLHAWVSAQSDGDDIEERAS